MTTLYKILFPNVFWNAKNNKVLLTIDDSPTNKGTEKVLKILNYYSIKGLFFVKGNECEHYSNLLKEIYSENHCIGNHSFNHNSMLFMNNKKISDEILRTDKIISESLSITPKYFRPPFGRFNFYNGTINKLDKVIVMWDVFTYDYKNNAKFIKFAIQKCRKNSIITMHDNSKTENNIDYNFKLVIESVLSKNFVFGDPIECLK